MVEHVEKFTSVFYRDTDRDAKSTLKKVREEDLKRSGWQEVKAYIQSLPDGRFRVVMKYCYAKWTCSYTKKRNIFLPQQWGSFLLQFYRLIKLDIKS